MNKTLLLILPILFACAGQEKKQQALNKWEGVKVSELKDHPYFKNLPMNKVKNQSGIETWILRDQTRYQTDAYCQGLGGCLGMPTYNCNNIFIVQNDVILDFEQNGSCPGPKTIEIKN